MQVAALLKCNIMRLVKNNELFFIRPWDNSLFKLISSGAF